jgi:hypothetical protein
MGDEWRGAGGGNHIDEPLMQKPADADDACTAIDANDS